MDYTPGEPMQQPQKGIRPQQIILFLGANVFMFMLLGSGIIALLCEVQGIDMKESFSSFGTSSPLEWRNFMRGAVLINHMTSFLLPALLTGWIFYKKKWPENLHVNQGPTLQNLGMGILFMAAAFPLAQKAFELNRWAVEQIPALQSLVSAEKATENMIEGLLVMQSPWEMLFSVLVMALVPAIGEELVFRGLLQKNMVRWLKNPVAGIALSALIFSVAHFEIQRFLAIFMLGLVLGCLFYWTKNLWVPIAAHFMNNGVQVLVAYANQDKLAELNQAEEVDIPIVFTIIAALLVFAIGYQFWKNNSTIRSQQQDPIEVKEEE